MMLVNGTNNLSCLRIGVSVLGMAVAVGCAQSAAHAQSYGLPSAPTPNSSSVNNPFWGSVTLHPATNEMLKLSLDEAVSRGLQTNLGLKQAEIGEKTLQGEKLEALQYFLPT